MTSTGDLLTGVSLGLLFGGPWLVASLYYWRRVDRDGVTQPSFGEQLRDRLIR